MGPSTEDFFADIMETTNAGKTLPNWCVGDRIYRFLVLMYRS